MMHKSQPKWKYYFSCHFIAVSAWLIMKSNYKKIPKDYRIDYWIGIGSATVSVSVIGTIIGLMLTFGLADNNINNNFGDFFNSIGMAMITLLYGYIIGNIVESCWPKKTV